MTRMTQHDSSLALGRWEWEGGVEILQPISRPEREATLEDRHRILECLGAAVVGQWNGLSKEVRRGLFQHATVSPARDRARLKAQIARYLHDHKNEAGAP